MSFILFFPILNDFEHIYIFFRDYYTFYVVFASNMKRDYTLYPSTLGARSGVVWFYNDPNSVTEFDDGDPLDIPANQCDNTSLCIWYISPLIPFYDPLGYQFALMGESNKWTPVSRQRFISIDADFQQTDITVTVQGVAGEIVHLFLYHSFFQFITVDCPISSDNGQALLVVDIDNVICYATT